MKSLLLVGMVSLTLMASSAFASSKQIHVKVKGMFCSSCAEMMTHKLMKQQGVQNVRVNLKKGFVDVTMKDGQDLTDAQIKSIVNDHDYSVATITRQ